VIADARLYAGGFRPALNDAIGVLLPERSGRQTASLACGRTERIAIVIAGDAGSLDILVQPSREAGPTGGGPARNNPRPSSE
jgi:hypothetical protein